VNRFDKNAKNWENDPRKLKQTEIIINNIKKYLNSTDIAMDYGTGTGLIAYSIKDLVKKVIAIDNSEGMLKVLNEKIAKNNVRNIKVLNKNLVTDSFKEKKGKFDVIIITMTLHHIKDIRDIFDKFYSLLKESGYLIIADLFTENGSFHKDNTNVAHFGFSKDFLLQEFKNTNFKLIEFKNLFNFDKNAKNYDMFLSVVRK